MTGRSAARLPIPLFRLGEDDLLGTDWMWPRGVAIMPSEAEMNIHRTDLANPIGLGSDDDLARFDPVLFTIQDVPKVDTLPPMPDPAPDHLDPHVAARRTDIDRKHVRLIEFLDAGHYDSVVLTRPESLAWITAGGDLGLDTSSGRSPVAIFVNRTTRAVLSNNVQSARVFEEEIAGLGFLLKEWPWHEVQSRVIADLTHNKRSACDGPVSGLIDESAGLRDLRETLTSLERHNLRGLGRTLTLAIEATCRNFSAGQTEADVAGQLAHRLIREGVAPVELRVAGDDRMGRYRQPAYKAAEIHHRATISVVGRRHGLCASASRTVSFGPVDRPFQDCQTLASMVDATCVYFSRPGEPISEVFRRLGRIYEKFGHPHEWMLNEQGSVIGYSPRERLFLPDCDRPIASHSALRWSPSVGPARSEDTIIVDDRGFEIVTEAQDWPKVEIVVKGFPIARPGILER